MTSNIFLRSGLNNVIFYCIKINKEKLSKIKPRISKNREKCEVFFFNFLAYIKG